MKPLVSIIIPTFNRAHLIEETLASVSAQSYTNWECIIVDDGSTDSTQEVVLAFAKADTRFSYFKRPENRPKGANACRNFGFEQSKGKYINWLDSDDVLDSSKIEAQVAILTKEEGSLVYCPWGRFVNSADRVLYKNYASYDSFKSVSAFLNALAISRGYFPIHAYLMSRSMSLKSGLWDENLIINQDGEFMSRVFIEVDRFYCAQNTSVFYRSEVAGSTSGYSSKEKAIASIASWKQIEKRLKYHSTAYIDFMKQQVYKNVKGTFPFLIEKEASFFRKQLFNERYKNHILMRILKKGKRIFKCK